jgi:hypothetical protein
VENAPPAVTLEDGSVFITSLLAAAAVMLNELLVPLVSDVAEAVKVAPVTAVRMTVLLKVAAPLVAVAALAPLKMVPLEGARVTLVPLLVTALPY